MIEDLRGPLMESIIEESEDEDLLERHLNGEEITADSVTDDVRAAIATARFFPIIGTHAPSGLGVDGLYDLFERGFPSPAAAALPAVYTPDGKPYGDLSCDPDGPLVAEVVRTTSTPFVGRLCLVRVFSGTLRADTPLHVSGHLARFAGRNVEGHPDHDSDDERVGPLSAPILEDSRPKPYAIAGDLVLVSKLAGAETSDTLSSKARPALVEPWLLPEPLLPVAIHASSRADEEKLASALQRLVAEDVTMRLEHNAETHQVVLWAMGPAHVDKLLGALRDSWHVAVEVEELRTSLRETFVGPMTVQGRLVKQSGGHGQYAVCRIDIEPLERGAGIEFAEKVVGGAVPRQFIPSVEKGAATAAGQGGAQRLSGGRRQDHPGRRQGPLGRLLRHGLPDRGRVGPPGSGERVDGGHPGTDRRPRDHRGRRLGRLGAGGSAGPAGPGARHRDRRTRRATPSSTPRFRRTSSPATRSSCARCPTAPAPSPGPSSVTTTCRPPWPEKSPAIPEPPQGRAAGVDGAVLPATTGPSRATG